MVGTPDSFTIHFPDTIKRRNRTHKITGFNRERYTLHCFLNNLICEYRQFRKRDDILPSEKYPENFGIKLRDPFSLRTKHYSGKSWGRCPYHRWDLHTYPIRLRQKISWREASFWFRRISPLVPCRSQFMLGFGMISLNHGVLVAKNIRWKASPKMIFLYI